MFRLRQSVTEPESNRDGYVDMRLDDTEELVLNWTNVSRILSTIGDGASDKLYRINGMVIN